MADFNSSLPVRTQTNGDVAVKIVDGTTVSQALGVDASGRLTIKLDDGAGNAVTSQASGAQRALDVGINVSGVQIDPRQIRLLTATDVVTAQQGSAPWSQNLTQVGGSTIALGQALMAASLPVVIASNQSAIPVSQSGSWTVTTTQGTSPWVTSDLADGSVAGGTAGTKSLLGGGIFNTAAPVLTNGQQASLQLDSSGNLDVNLKTPIPAGTNSIGTVILGAGTAIAGKIEITDGTNVAGVSPASTAVTATQPALAVGLSPNSPLPAGTNAIGSVLANIQVANAAVSATNPVPVALVSSTPGTAVQDYHTSASLATGSSVVFTYTVAAGHTFSFERAWASASGKIKAVVAIAGTTAFAGFNSTANPNIDITVVAPPTVAAAATVTITITNDDLLAMDVYATIEGNQN